MSDQQASPGTSPKTTNATSAGVVTTAITVLNIALGFGFQSLIAFALGLGALADAFQLTWAIVTFGTTVFYTLVTTVLVPRVHDGSNSVRLGDARHLAVFGIIATALQVFAAIFTAQPLTDLLLYSAPSHLLAAITAPAVTLAYLEHRFALAAIGNVYNGLGLLAAAAIAVRAGPTPANLGIALTAGYTTQFLLTALPLRNNLRSVDWRAAIGIRPIVGLILFTMLTKLQPVLERTISESFGIGSTAALGFGQKISQGLLLLGAFGLAITATGSLSRAFASGDGPLTARLFGRTLTSTFITSSLIIAFFIPFSRFSVQILFQRGEFTAYDTNSVFSVLLFQLPWVFAGAMTGVVTSYMYVARQYARVAASSASGLIATLVASALLMKTLPNEAVAAGSSIGAVTTLVMAIGVTFKQPVWPDALKEVGRFSALLSAAAVTLAASAITLCVVRSFVSGPMTTVAVIGPLLAFSLSFCWRPTRDNCRELLNVRL